MSKEKIKTVSFTNAVMAGAFTVGSTGSLSTFLTGSSFLKNITKVEIKLGLLQQSVQPVILGIILCQQRQVKAYNGSIHASKKK